MKKLRVEIESKQNWGQDFIMAGVKLVSELSNSKNVFFISKNWRILH